MKEKRACNSALFFVTTDPMKAHIKAKLYCGLTRLFITNSSDHNFRNRLSTDPIKAPVKATALRISYLI
jgi:hypothetical protein